MRPFVLLILFLTLFSKGQGQGYNFVGSSTSDGGDCFILTQPQPWQNGAIWYNEAINITEPFQLQFTAGFGTLDALGADGMVFVMQQAGNNVIGNPGQGMGFEGFSPSLGVEFDSFQNAGNGDPAFDHMAILSNGNANHNLAGNLAGPIQISPDSDNVEDGQDYIIDISWDPAANLFSVSVNCEVRLQININLQFAIFSNSQDVFWGFTGATGGEFNLQRICLDPLILGLPETYDACANEPVQLEAPAASFGTVSWEPAAFLDDPNSFNPVATVSETTTFTLTFEDLCGNAQTQETTLVVAEPSVELGPDITDCDNGGGVPLTATGQFDEILWSDGTDQPTTTVTQSGTYWVDAIQGICAVSDTVEVTIDSPPAYSGPTQVALCEGETFTFQVDDNEDDILWFDNSTDETRVFDQSGAYAFDLINGVCTESYVLNVDVTQEPAFSLGPDQNDCGDEPLTLTAPAGFDQITWFDDSQGPSIEVSASGTYWADAVMGSCEVSDTVNVDLDAPPDYSGTTDIELCDGEVFTFQLGANPADITWFDASTAEVRDFDAEGNYPFELTQGECTSAYSLDVVVNTIPVFTLGPDLALCEGTSAVLQPAPEVNLIWSDGSTGDEFLVTEAGLYWATANENDCEYADTVSVSAIPKPTLALSGTAELCPDDTGTLFAQSSVPVVWNTGETDNQLSIDSPGQYSAVATTDEGCSTNATIYVSALSIPSITPLEDEVKCIGDDAVITAQSSSDRNLEWSDGTRGRTIRVQDVGMYTVSLSNSCGTVSQTVLVEEEECFTQFYLPNAFTPDGDGLNDLFKGQIGEHVTFEMQIFNRQGEQVFQTTDPSDGWNGSFQNDDFYCPAGVYAVRYSIDFGENELEEGFSTVLLIR
jgi:gliding motility-associated-like protein